VFSHVAIEWSGLIHDMPYDGKAALYSAEEFFDVDGPSDCCVYIPYSLTAEEEAAKALWIQNCYDGKTVEKLRVVLWRLKYRPRWPRTCATLASLWIKLVTGWDVDAVEPDELYRQLLRKVVAQHA
jgi:hypothetical protein